MVKNDFYYDVVTSDTSGQPLVNHYVTYWTPKTTKNDFLGFFGPLIQFKSFNSTANDLKGFLLWSSTIGHHSRMWKLGPEGSEGAQKVPNMAENVPKVTYWTIDRIWIV